jgi:pimeloyl-ACP methyl ester carboxylesterase
MPAGEDKWEKWLLEGRFAQDAEKGSLTAPQRVRYDAAWLRSVDGIGSAFGHWVLAMDAWPAARRSWPGDPSGHFTSGRRYLPMNQLSEERFMTTTPRAFFVAIRILFLSIALSLIDPHFVARAQTAAPAIQVEEGVVKLADSNIEYFSRGEGETIVLLPAGTLTVGYLDGLAEALAKGGYRVIGINFRGSGKSTGPSTGVTLQTMANDVAGVIQALKLGSVHVVGNDFGNRVARVLDSSHPELIRSVILLAAGGKVPPKPPAARALSVIFNPASSDAEVLGAMKYMVVNPADVARVFQVLKSCRAPKAAGIEKAAAEATPLAAWWAPPGQTKYLILQGADDQIAPPANGVLLQKDLGGRATLVNVPQAGHLLPLEKTQTTASHMISFIRQLDAKTHT